VNERPTVSSSTRRGARSALRSLSEGSLPVPSTTRLQLLGVLEHRDVALRAVAIACRMVTVLPRGRAWKEFQQQVVSAVGEGFNNVVLHGNIGGASRPRTGGDIDLRIKTGPGWIQIELRDWGPGFDPSRVRTPPGDPLPECGMGLHIMRSFMDMSYRAGRPNLLKLNKRLLQKGFRPAQNGAADDAGGATRRRARSRA
jgi:anti-sigma regulatory factor (Ser/Thr protein kinase)